MARLAEPTEDPGPFLRRKPETINYPLKSFGPYLVVLLGVLDLGGVVPM